jgi:hypothetical protein
MQKSGVVDSVEISSIAHATEDPVKVETALRALLPDELKGREIFTKQFLQGHYTNPITTYEARLKRPAEVNAFVNNLIHKLPRIDRLRVERDLHLHSDSEGNLFIRVNKQRAFSGSIELGGDDPVRIKMKFTRLKGDTQELMKQLLESE